MRLKLARKENPSQEGRGGRAAHGTPSPGAGGKWRPPQGALGEGGEEWAAGPRAAALTVSLLAVDHPHEQRRVPGELRGARDKGAPRAQPPPPPLPPCPARPGPQNCGAERDGGRGCRGLTLMRGETCTGGIILAAELAAESGAAAEGSGRKAGPARRFARLPARPYCVTQ